MVDILILLGHRGTLLLISAVEVFLFYRLWETKVSAKKQVIACSVFLILRLLFRLHLTTYSPILFLGGILLVLIVELLFFKYVFLGKVRVFILWSVIITFFDGISSAVAGGLFLALTDFPIGSLYSGYANVGGIIAFNMHNALKLLIFYFITLKTDKSHILSIKESIMLAVVPAIGFIFPLAVFINIQELLPADSYAQAVLVAGAFLLLISAFHVAFYNRTITNNKEKYELQLQSKMQDMTKTHITQIHEVYGKLEDLQHGLRNHFGAITGYINAEKINELKAYVEKITQDSIDIYTYCKNPVLNALVSAKAKIAREENIEFTVNIALPFALPISDVDLCILVGNLLDNAFEAKENHIHGYYVDLTIKWVDAYCVISCKNKSDKPEDFTSFQNLQSTKTDNEHTHGIGTRQIQKVAEDTGGFVTYKHEAGEFSALVMLKL